MPPSTDNTSPLIQYEFNGYAKGNQLFNIKATSGFFCASDFEAAKGLPPKYSRQIPRTIFNDFKPLLTCTKNSFSDDDIQALQKGDLAQCFGKQYAQYKGISLGNQFKMLSRIPVIDLQGGIGLGLIVGEADIKYDHWVFKAHFKNDPVMPGTMLLAGCSETLFFFANYIGMPTLFRNCQATSLANSSNTTKFRGEIKAMDTQVQYHVVIKEIVLEPRVYIVADVEIVHKGSVIGICVDVAICFSEKG